MREPGPAGGGLVNQPQVSRQDPGSCRHAATQGWGYTTADIRCVNRVVQMTASEMLFQARHQRADPNFVMVKYVHDKDDEGHLYKEFTAYQVSEQCVQMATANKLRCVAMRWVW